MASEAFVAAFNEAMRLITDGRFNPYDPAVISGRKDTELNRMKVAWADDPVYAGGATKFGICQNSVPTILIDTMTMDEAMGIYERKHWNGVSAYSMPPKIGAYLFDCSIYAGPVATLKMLQRALGVRETGKFDDATEERLQTKDEQDLLEAIYLQRKRHLVDLCMMNFDYRSMFDYASMRAKKFGGLIDKFREPGEESIL